MPCCPPAPAAPNAPHGTTPDVPCPVCVLTSTLALLTAYCMGEASLLKAPDVYGRIVMNLRVLRAHPHLHGDLLHVLAGMEQRWAAVLARMAPAVHEDDGAAGADAARSSSWLAAPRTMQ